MTKILVHDTIALFQPLFTSREHPKVLFSRAQQPLLSPNGLMHQLQHALADKRRNGFDVMATAQHDGYESLMGQQGWGLFNPSRSRDASDWEFAQYQQTAILEQIERALTRCVERLELAEQSARLPQIQCFLVPGDPANRTFMAFNHGLSGFGGAPGYLLLRVWPSAGNLARLPSVLARLVAQNARHAAQPRGLLTLGDWLLLEGFAATFVAMVGFPLHAPPWLVAFARPDDWDWTLEQIAQFYGIASYNDLVVNVYGGQVPIGSERLPQAAALDPEDLTYAVEIIGAALDAVDATTIAAYMYGDAIVAAQGHPGVGLPPYAGFEVGYWLVQSYLSRSGRRWNEAILRPSAEILEAIGGSSRQIDAFGQQP
jgi:uncharacterized protein YjaZ